MFRAPFGKVFANPISANDDALPWWRSGGVPASLCVAAYAPKGAASLAASYINLVTPGTYDAAPGVAPTWASATGWTGNGTKYLLTGIPVAANTSIIARFVSGSGGSSTFLLGAEATGTGMFCIVPNRTTAVRWYNRTQYDVAPAFGGGTGGTLCISTTKMYRNGVDEGLTATARTASAYPLYLLSERSLASPYVGSMQACAVYSADISSYVLAIHTAMMAL
jgi:hypothetical protein